MWEHMWDEMYNDTPLGLLYGAIVGFIGIPFVLGLIHFVRLRMGLIVEPVADAPKDEAPAATTKNPNGKG